MTLRIPFPTLLALCIWMFAAAPAMVAAQDDAGVPSLVEQSLKAMNEEHWEEAHKILTRATQQLGANPLVVFGPQAGVIPYRKGICEMKLGMFKAAMASFETCYKDFPNQAGPAGAPAGNIFSKRALLKWGEAAQADGQYQAAIELYKKFIAERDKNTDTYPQGVYYVNLAICHLKIGKIPEGIENLEIAIANKAKFKTPPPAIIAAYQALVGAAIAAKNEQALLDFIGRNRAQLTMRPYEMLNYSPLFLKLAVDAFTAGMELAAMEMYGMIPDTRLAIADLKGRIAEVAPRRGLVDGNNTLDVSKMKADLARAEEAVKNGEVMDIYVLEGLAILHERASMPHAAYAAYLEIEQRFPANKKREEHLFHLVRTSSLIGAVVATEKFGEAFRKDFPASQRLEAVEQVMLSSLFYHGDYEKCIALATALIGKLRENTDAHDFCLHVLGASYYYSGQYETATALLEKHVRMYGKSRFAMAALFFEGSNQIRLQAWEGAAAKLDSFLTKFPNAASNPYLPFALYDRAMAHYCLSEPDDALAKLSVLEKNFSSSAIMANGFNLRGNILQGEKDAAGAEAAYRSALKLADAAGNKPVGAEALLGLIAMLGHNKASAENLKAAAELADKFWADYSAGSSIKIQVSVAGMGPYRAVGRGDEALGRLRDAITELASRENSAGMEEAINSYTEFFLESHSLDELKEHFYSFPGVKRSDKAALALLRVAIIRLFEQELTKAADDAEAARRAEAMITVLFRELATDFVPADLSPSILVRLGDHLREKVKRPSESLPYYEEAIRRKDPSSLSSALLGRAEVKAMSPSAGDLDQAAADFAVVYRDGTAKGQKEAALFRMIEIYAKKKDFAKVDALSFEYLDSRQGANNFQNWAGQVGLLRGQAFEGRNNLDAALTTYLQVWTSKMGDIKASAPAIEAWMKLLWQRNKAASGAAPADRQGAYEQGYRYLDLTRRFFDRMSAAEQVQWKGVETLVATYAGNPEIKSMEEVQREKNK